MDELDDPVATAEDTRRALVVARLKDYQASLSQAGGTLLTRARGKSRDEWLLDLARSGADGPGGKDGPFPDGDSSDEQSWTLAMAIAMFIQAVLIAERTPGERGEKMVRASERLASGLDLLFQDAGADPDRFEDVFTSMVGDWSEAERIRLLIDLSFSNPFFPYELDIKQKDFEFSLQVLAVGLGFRRDVVAEIRDVRRSAQAAHRKIDWAKIGLLGAGGAIVIGIGGYALAPILATSIGAAAGLTGAAATSYGLAVLGGGSLAAGGAGMAGGLWLVTGVGAAAGVIGGSGGAALYRMGAAQARAELVRLQVTFKMTVLTQHVDTLKAQAVIKSLDSQLKSLTESLDQERELNDKNSQRVEELEAKLTALEESLEWVQSEEVDAA